MKNPNDPKNIKDKLILITSLECRLNFLYERFCLLKANKTLLFSKKEIAYLKKISPNKLFQIN